MGLAGALAVIAAVVLAVGHERPTPSRGTAAVEVTYVSAASLRAALVRHPAMLVQDIPALGVAELRPAAMRRNTYVRFDAWAGSSLRALPSRAPKRTRQG
jgi:hypothetical protein